MVRFSSVVFIRNMLHKKRKQKTFQVKTKRESHFWDFIQIKRVVGRSLSETYKWDLSLQVFNMKLQVTLVTWENLLPWTWEQYSLPWVCSIPSPLSTGKWTPGLLLHGPLHSLSHVWVTEEVIMQTSKGEVTHNYFETRYKLALSPGTLRYSATRGVSMQPMWLFRVMARRELVFSCVVFA